jgi:MraZ protein
MFVGEYQHSVDQKGRVAVPAKFRELLNKGAVLTRGNDGCLTIYRLNDWEILMDKIAKLPQTKTEVRNYLRFLLSGAVEVKLDSQGRVNLPTFLAQFAGIKKKVVFVGMYNKLELWDGEKWESYREQIEDQGSMVLEELEEYGL